MVGDMPDWLQLMFQVGLEIVVLGFLLFGLVGLIVPVFPGLTVMWLGPLFYAIAQLLSGKMTGWDWAVFGFITFLMLVGNIADNLIIARKMRDHYIPWRSILFAFAAGILASIFLTPLGGLVAAPTALFLAETSRLKNRDQAWNSTRAYMVGWGWAFGVRFMIGLVIAGLWMFWAWV
jgi:uncharacterized protein YqgC (DUF456 family)